MAAWYFGGQQPVSGRVGFVVDPLTEPDVRQIGRVKPLMTGEVWPLMVDLEGILWIQHLVVEALQRHPVIIAQGCVTL